MKLLYWGGGERSLLECILSHIYSLLQLNQCLTLVCRPATRVTILPCLEEEKLEMQSRVYLAEWSDQMECKATQGSVFFAWRPDAGCCPVATMNFRLHWSKPEKRADSTTTITATCMWLREPCSSPGLCKSASPWGVDGKSAKAISCCADHSCDQ